MESMVNFLSENKLLLIIIFGIALARGLFFPDFRYGVLSIVIIQIVVPVLLFFIVAIYGFNSGKYILPLAIGFLCISLSQIVSSANYYLTIGSADTKSAVSGAIMIGSFLGQIVMLFLSALIFLVINKLKS